MTIGVNKTSYPHPAYGWGYATIKNLQELSELIRTYPYHIVVKFKCGQRKTTNIEKLSEFAIVDVDNDGKAEYCSISKMVGILYDLQINYLLATTKRHQIDGYGDRYRIIIPLAKQREWKDVQTYKLEQKILIRLTAALY